MKVMTCSWFDTERLEAAILDGRRIVSISRGEPDGWTGKFQHKIWEFCPPGPLLGAFKRGEADEEQYQKVYTETIGKRIHKGIAQLKEGDVLCCWETEGNFCHRVILADLLIIHEVI
jgi:hypothetical protein